MIQLETAMTSIETLSIEVIGSNIEAIAGTAIEPLFFLGEPQKRIYWLYLLSAAMLAIAAGILKNVPVANTLKRLLSPTLWFSRSSKVDVQWMLLNNIAHAFLIVPVIGGQIAIALWISGKLYSSLGQGNFITVSPIATSLLFTLTYVLFEDFSRFHLHYLYHKIPLLWRFHAIHHSADTLTPITLYRIHTIELLLNSIRGVLVAGFVSGVFLYAFKGKLQIVDILGANIFSFLFNMAGSNLRHSPIWLSYGRLEHWVVSPAQHQIHHSADPVHFDKNMGAMFAIWDKLFGTHMLSQEETVTRYGINKPGDHQSIKRQLLGL